MMGESFSSYGSQIFRESQSPVGTWWSAFSAGFTNGLWVWKEEYQEMMIENAKIPRGQESAF